MEIVGSLQTWGIDDRPAEGSAKQAVWLGDWNGDGISEYFVTTKKGGTSSFFYSTGEGTWQHTSHWYAPSYSVIALDTQGDARPEYIIKTSKFQTNENITKEMFEDYVPGLKRSWTTVFRIPEDPINNPLEPVMTFDRSVPIVQGCMDIDGDDTNICWSLTIWKIRNTLLVTTRARTIPLMANHLRQLIDGHLLAQALLWKDP